MHALIVGERFVGKSTLVRRVVSESGKRAFGFETRKEDDLADEVNGSPIYIYTPGEEHVHSEENLVGYCKAHHPKTYKEAFDRFAEKMHDMPADAIGMMDEIGFMEAASPAFCDAIMALLDGKTPVIAAVKDLDHPFLEQVRTHPNCKCFFITPENRDALTEEVLRFMKAQFAAAEERA